MVITTNYQMTALPSLGVESAASCLQISRPAGCGWPLRLPHSLQQLLAPQGFPECFPSVLCPAGGLSLIWGSPHWGFPRSISSHRRLGRWRLGDFRARQINTHSGPGPQAPEAQSTPPLRSESTWHSGIASAELPWEKPEPSLSTPGLEQEPRARTQKTASLLECPPRAWCCVRDFLEYLLSPFPLWNGELVWRGRKKVGQE